MNIRNLIFFVLIITTFISTTHSQTEDEFKEAIKTLMTESYQSDSVGLEKSIRNLDRFTEYKQISHLVYYYKAFGKWQAVLRMSSGAMGSEHAKSLINSAVSDLKKSMSIKENFADAIALDVNCHYILYYVEPQRRLEFVRHVSNSIKKALELEPENPRIILTDAQNIYHTPAQFGGDQMKGIARYKEAIEKFKKEKAELPLPQWGLPIAYAWLGNAYLNLQDENLLKAKEAFDQAVQLRHDFSWVKDTMLPQLDNRINTFIKNSNLKPGK